MLDLWDAQTCWRRALWSWSCIWGSNVCVCLSVCLCVCVYVLARRGWEMCSDPACGCRGCRTVRTSCVASAWTRCGTSQRRPSGSSASCPTAATPTAWAACMPGGRAEGTSRPVSSSKGLGEASRERGKGPQERWACHYSSFTFHSPTPTPSPRRACPQCRVHSSYIIPCRFWVSQGPEKEQLIRNFKARTR